MISIRSDKIGLRLAPYTLLLLALLLNAAAAQQGPADSIESCADIDKYPYHWIFQDGFPCSDDLPLTELPQLEDKELWYEGIHGLFYVPPGAGGQKRIFAHYPDKDFVLITLVYYSTLDLEVTSIETADGRPGIIASGPTGWTTRSMRMTGSLVVFYLDTSYGPNDFFLLDRIIVTFEPPTTESPIWPSSSSPLPPISTTQVPRIDEFIDTCQDRTKYEHWVFQQRIQCFESLPEAEEELPLDGLNLHYPNIAGLFYVKNTNTEFFAIYPSQDSVLITLSYYSTQDLEVTNVITPDGRPGIIKSTSNTWTIRTLEVDQRGGLIQFLINLSEFNNESDFFLLDKISVTFGTTVA